MDIVVLEGNKRKRKSRVAAEPEGQRNVEHIRATVAGRQGRGTTTLVTAEHGIQLDALVVRRA